MTAYELITKHLQDAHIMQLATCVDNYPWCATVHFAADEQCNLYWLSLPSRRHSQQIATNAKVAGAIVPPGGEAPQVQGIQFEGEARMVTEPERIQEMLQTFADRYRTNSVTDEAIISGVAPVRLYQLKPSLFVLYDEVHFPDEPRQEWRPV
jgi:uncharacterized protein YhbP (UPF0306 family)